MLLMLLLRGRLWYPCLYHCGLPEASRRRCSFARESNRSVRPCARRRTLVRTHAHQRCVRPWARAVRRRALASDRTKWEWQATQTAKQDLQQEKRERG